MRHLPNTYPTSSELAQANQKLAAENARYKDELRQANASLQQHRALLGQFGHQLRMPLSAIIGYGEILHRSSMDGEVKEKLSLLLNAADTLMTIMNDMPTAHNTGDTHPRPCNPAVLVPQLEGFFIGEAQLKGLDYTIHWDSAIPEGLYCDLARLRQILIILVHNAIKFTAQGHVTVDIRLQQVADHEAAIIFSVEDTGVGIAADMLPHLFEPRPTVSRGTFGRAGHSLPLAAQWIRSMGGELQAESALEKGSRFSFHLVYPIHYPREIAPETEPTTTISDWQHAQILVVDDDAMNRELLATMARNLGIGQVDTAMDGAAAAEKALACDYDLVLMDCQMPRMDGFAAARLLRGQPHTAALPIIGVTADVIRTDTAKCYAAGMEDYYHKPVTLTTLERIFHKWLTVSSRQASTA